MPQGLSWLSAIVDMHLDFEFHQDTVGEQEKFKLFQIGILSSLFHISSALEIDEFL